MSNLVYCAHHAEIRTVLKMFHEILKIAQDYDKVHPIGAIKETIFFQIWEVMEHYRKFQFKMGLPKIIKIPFHHVLANKNDLKFKKGAPLKQFFNINLGIGIIQILFRIQRALLFKI